MNAVFTASSILLLTSLFVAAPISTRADEVDMHNGDHYTGKVLSLDDNSIVLTNDLLGTLRIRRDKVSSISFGAKPAAAAVTGSPAVVPSQPLKVPRVATLTSRAIAAGPKAAAKFDELVDGLAAGNIDVADLRKQAESVAVQLRQLRGSADDESGEILDEYLSVLDQFVREAGTTSAKSSNATRPGSARKLISSGAPSKSTAASPPLTNRK